MRRVLLPVLPWLVVLSGCFATTRYPYPKTSEHADILVNLYSNIERTAFYVDGNRVGTGRRVKIYIDDREHTIAAKPEGYISKEEFIQPPYRDDLMLSFTFLIGEQTTSAAAGAAREETASDTDSPALTSDIDTLPAVTPARKPNNYAIVIGIEKYRQSLPKATFAGHDARTVTEYLTKALGYPEENVVTLINERALKSDLEKYFEQWLANNVGKNDTVFVYYSGHGAPNPKTGDAFLVPHDGDPTFIQQTGYPLKRLYESLGKLQARQIVVALDSCFSGAGGRSLLAKGARPLVMDAGKTFAIPPNVTVLAAASADQISSSYEEKGHGLFTYFFLKGIKETIEKDRKSSLPVKSVFHYLKPQVESISRKVNNNEQVPQLITPDATSQNSFTLL